MKIVSCKNCGAKYQLEDNDDLSTFECTYCAGDLEPSDDYSSDESDNSAGISVNTYHNSFITHCVDCGLKYRLSSNDNILDYECESCGGSLRYLDEEMNKELDEILKERENQKIRDKIESKETIPTPEVPIKKTGEKATNSIKSLSNKIENFFSEDYMQKIAKEEDEENQDNFYPKTARTVIPKAVLSKFEKEFAVPKSNNYNVLMDYLKEEFYKGVMKYYNVPDNGKLELSEILNTKTDIATDDIKTNHIIIAIGIIAFLVSAIEIFTIDSGIGILGLFVGVIILCYGIYKTKDDEETEKRSKIIREHLLTLPEEYYVFYNVKIPTSASGINHLVVGPSGIYGIISQKYNSKVSLNSDNENKSLIESTESHEQIEEIITANNMRLFKYTTKQTKFTQDNKVKQKSLKLGENLINFLNLNGIKNCFVEPLVGFVNNEVVVINMPLTDEDLFIDELIHKIKYSPIKLDSETIDKCAVLLNKYSADCSEEY